MRKGFTLIELLAVIIILSIIALIATPIMFNVIEDSEETAAQQSADYYIEAVKLALSSSELKGNLVLDGSYSIMENGNICLAVLTNNICSGDVLEVKTSGKNPTGGTITIKEGEIVFTSLLLNGT